MKLPLIWKIVGFALLAVNGGLFVWLAYTGDTLNAVVHGVAFVAVQNAARDMTP